MCGVWSKEEPCFAPLRTFVYAFAATAVVAAAPPPPSAAVAAAVAARRLRCGSSLAALHRVALLAAAHLVAVAVHPTSRFGVAPGAGGGDTAHGVAGSLAGRRAPKTAPLTGPPPQTKRAKLAFFDKHVTPVCSGLFVGGDAVARSREALTAAGVTHVLNATGFTSPEYFRRQPRSGVAADGGAPLSYRSLWLADTASEDLLCVLYAAFDFIEAARLSGGACLVHCTQGVSRSCALATAYLMWRNNVGWEEAAAAVREQRQISSPNLGFVFQLSQWAKRRGGGSRLSTGGDGGLGLGVRLFRMAPHSLADPRLIVPRPVIHRPIGPQLDCRTAFVLLTSFPGCTYVWAGQEAAPARGLRACSRSSLSLPPNFCFPPLKFSIPRRLWTPRGCTRTSWGATRGRPSRRWCRPAASRPTCWRPSSWAPTRRTSCGASATRSTTTGAPFGGA